MTEKILNGLLGTLNTWLEFSTGNTIPEHRRRIPKLLLLSFGSLIGGIYLARICGGSQAIMVLCTIVAIVPWLMLAWLAAVIAFSLSAPKTILEKIAKIQGTEGLKEKAKNAALRFVDIAVWILVAGLYCIVFRTWNHLSSLPLLLLVVVFFALGTAAAWTIPSPKLKRQIFAAVMLVIFIPVSLNLVASFHLFGFVPEELSNPLPKSERTWKKALKELRETADQRQSSAIDSVKNSLAKRIEKGELTISEAEDSLDAFKQEFIKNSLPAKAWKTASSPFHKKPKSRPAPGNGTAAKNTIGGALYVGDEWVTVPKQIHRSTSICIASPDSGVYLKFTWEVNDAARKFPGRMESDGIFRGCAIVPDEPYDQSTRLQIKILGAKEKKQIKFT